MTDTQQAGDAQPSVLRIVDGRLAGKQYPLGGGRVCVGHGLANDVVLRGAGTRDGALEVRLSGESATLRVLSGQVELLGRVLTPGDDAVLPPYLPFRFGEFVLAHGERESPRWSEAAAVAASRCVAPVTPLPAPRLADRLATYGRDGIVALRGRMGSGRAALAAGSILLLAVSFAPVRSAIEAQGSGPTALDRRLERAGWRQLSVADNPAGGLIVSGMVRSEGELARVRTLVAQQHQPVLLDVTTSAALAGAATDILRAQGVDAKAEPAGLAGIAVIAPYLSADRRASLEAVLRRDLPGLERVAFRLDDARGGDPLQSFFARSGAGLAAVVEDPGHIVTADGARWFPGAILPTGHRLVSVGKGSVRFEKDGRTEEIRL